MITFNRKSVVEGGVVVEVIVLVVVVVEAVVEVVVVIIVIQGMVDGSASKPALRLDTGYIVEKTYLDIAPYLGAFGAYLMPQ